MIYIVCNKDQNSNFVSLKKILFFCWSNFLLELGFEYMLLLGIRVWLGLGTEERRWTTNMRPLNFHLSIRFSISAIDSNSQFF